jgi:PilZ domain
MEQRKTRRFQLELPLSITRAGADRISLSGLTKNISSTGVLFTTASAPDLGGPIEYVITLNEEGPQPVSLRCMGKVLRSERMLSNGDGRRSFEIAATLERYEFVRARELSLVR